MTAGWTLSFGSVLVELVTLMRDSFVLSTIAVLKACDVHCFVSGRTFRFALNTPTIND